MTALTGSEKILYHQIHPAKLSVDIGATPLALYLFWTHQLAWALVVSFVPSIAVSILVVRFADLNKYAESKLGRYVERHMTRAVEAVRLAGFVLMAVGAWVRLWWPIPVGVAVVLFGWLRGLVWPSRIK